MKPSAILCLAALFSAAPAVMQAQSNAPDREALIRNALSAAPASVGEGATVADFAGNVLLAGTTDWVCMPDMADVPNDSPMCVDAVWREVLDAWMNRREPRFSGIGIGYMLQGDMPVSNTDPFATGPTPDNQWLADGSPHIMMVVSEQALLEGLPTDPHNGGPWVMWKGTPYAHLMIPTVPRRQ